MGCCDTITTDKFPKQGKYLNEIVKVCFHYDTQNLIKGIVVRDDVEEPWRIIIKLNDGRYVLGDECQWSPA
jgi:hypothetical protein